jgi:asparagine synthetase B (glutamine-hydrolysing)
MCGIFFSLTRDDYVVPDASTEQLLKNRGPDSIGKHQTLIPQPQDRKCHATFISTVLSLRGASVVEQPLRDPSNNSVLCWNGEAWSVGGQPVQGNDSARVFQHLLRRRPAGSENDRKASITQVVEQVATIRGPFAFVFYDAVYNYLYWGRDCLGRRSLLRRQPAHNELIISSVCDGSTGDRWTEVDAIGVSIIDLTTFPSNSSSGIFDAPYSRRDMPGIIGLHMVGKSFAIRKHTNTIRWYPFL